MTTNRPLDVSDLIFPEATTQINRFAKEVKRSALGVKNRLRSIQYDADFVQDIQDTYGLPLIANERCGSWYIDPAEKAQSAYFKSTDGHAGQWSFSLRRLNLQVLETIIEYGGCIIVDSTRRGKSMPDALSKTVPLWIAVLNRLFFPKAGRDSIELRTPTAVVPPSEHSQMASRVDSSVNQLKALNLDLSRFHSQLKKPLRPVWVTQSSSWPALSSDDDNDFYPVILCTASRQVPGGEDSENGYIQGAADDSESWGHGLTPALFWLHREILLNTAEDDLPTVIADLLASSRRDGAGAERCHLVKPTTDLCIGSNDCHVTQDLTSADVVIICSPDPSPTFTSQSDKPVPTQVQLKCSEGKIGSRQLRHELVKVTSVLDEVLTTQSTTSDRASRPRVLATCPTGKDHSVGAALAILCLYARDDGSLAPRGKEDGTNAAGRPLSKDFIKQRLSWISVSIPDANPSRTTLQSVNAFLLG